MKLAIFDRIGTLHPEGEGAIVSAQEWQPQPGVVEAIAQLNRAGWHVVTATNQPGLGRGSVDVNEVNGVHARMHRQLALAGARIEAMFFCPHTPEEHCSCRKPAAGLLEQIAARYGAEPHEMWVVGQHGAHIQAGVAFGAHVAWIEQGSRALLPGQSLPDVVQRFASWSDWAQALAPAAADVDSSSAPL